MSTLQRMVWATHVQAKIAGRASSLFLAKKQWLRDFPGGPVVKMLSFHRMEHEFDLWLGN